MTMEMQISTPTPMNTACRTPFLARFTFFAPRFCPTKVVAAWPMLWAGRTVDICLYQSIGKRCESLLDTGRKSDPEDLTETCFIDM